MTLLLTLLLNKLLNKLVAPEARTDGLATLLHHVSVHDVETGPPDDKETGKDVSTEIPGSRLGERQAIGKGGEDAHCLGAGTDRVEDEEGGVASPEETRTLLTEKLIGVERVADALGDSPSEHHRGVEGARPGLRVSLSDTPDHEETRSDLDGSGSDRAPDPADSSVDYLENGKRLDECHNRADKGVRVGSTLEDSGNTLGEEVGVRLHDANLDETEASEHISGELDGTGVRLRAESEVLDER